MPALIKLPATRVVEGVPKQRRPSTIKLATADFDIDEAESFTIAALGAGITVQIGRQPAFPVPEGDSFFINGRRSGRTTSGIKVKTRFDNPWVIFWD